MGIKKEKVLNFDTDIKEQLDAFYTLDLVKYYQTRFITKLIEDFKRQNNITDNTSYEELRNIVKAYIGIPVNNSKSKNPLNTLTPEQMNILIQLIEERNSQGNVTTNIPNTVKENVHQIPTVNISNDDDPNSDTLNTMLNGFSAMMDE